MTEEFPRSRVDGTGAQSVIASRIRATAQTTPVVGLNFRPSTRPLQNNDANATLSIVQYSSTSGAVQYTYSIPVLDPGLTPVESTPLPYSTQTMS